MEATAFLINMEVELHKFTRIMVGTTKNGGLNKLEMAGSLLEVIVQVIFLIQTAKVTLTLLPKMKVIINTGYFRKSKVQIENFMLKTEQLEDTYPNQFGVMMLRQMVKHQQFGVLMTAFGDLHQYDIKSDSLLNSIVYLINVKL